MKHISELFKKYGEFIKESAKKHKLDEAILGALCWVESRGNPTAKSPCGAYGLTQVMLATAKYRGYKLKTPEQQINAGANYLAYMLNTFADGNIERALAAYNAGPLRLRGDRWKLIKETRKYVPDVLAFAEEYKELITPPPPPEPVIPEPEEGLTSKKVKSRQK